MILVLASMWPQPLAPVHSLGLSALVAAVPLAIVLALMGVLRTSSLLASVCGLAAAGAMAILVWHMPPVLAMWSTIFGCVYAVWPILWIVFAALWLYNLTVATGKFDLLRHWMERHVSSDPCIQAIVVAFSFGALLEGTAGFGAPVAVTAFLLVGLGFEARKAIVVSLIADTAPVAFGALGIPIVALQGVTNLDLQKLSSMVGRQLPLMSFIIPFYLACVVAGVKGLKRTWPAALVAGGSFAGAQFFVSNYWGPYTPDIIAAAVSIAATVGFLRIWKPSELAKQEEAQPAEKLSSASVFVAWLPWMLLTVVTVVWSYRKLLSVGQIVWAIPHLHKGVLITLYGQPYSALYTFQPLAAGTAALTGVVLTAICFRVRPGVFAACGWKTLRQLRLPGLTVIVIVGLAYLYNYSGMAYTLGAAAASAGRIFPLLSSYLGWVACFLSGSDTASNVLFGNLQVAAAHQLHLSPVLMAATNTSGAVAGKMISPQNIAVGVTTVGLIAQEGKVLRSSFWHSVAFAALVGVLAYAQAYWITWMVP
ncbi:MAG TPA: L-lactate permease [Candidatus Baltobacteraceae bacterium]|nr:L-lactate permease [Candidatus Baltobacteraceae bacterium]